MQPKQQQEMSQINSQTTSSNSQDTKSIDPSYVQGVNIAKIITASTSDLLSPRSNKADQEHKCDMYVRDETIEVIAPPGKLGVVIDTPNDGAPVVHAIKDKSTVADRLRLGDKLVAVDGVDVTSMTAIKVSQMISKASANPERKLTIVRSIME